MTQCAEHVDYQLPNELTRVTYLLDEIENNYARLQDAMALCINDQDPGGNMNDFEATAAFHLPHDPVSTKRDSARRGPMRWYLLLMEMWPLRAPKSPLAILKVDRKSYL